MGGMHVVDASVSPIAVAVAFVAAVAVHGPF